MQKGHSDPSGRYTPDILAAVSAEGGGGGGKLSALLVFQFQNICKVTRRPGLPPAFSSACQPLPHTARWWSGVSSYVCMTGMVRVCVCVHTLASASSALAVILHWSWLTVWCAAFRVQELLLQATS